MQNTEDYIRINSAIARLGICSRRQAEELIKAGRISINGEQVTNLALKVAADTEIEVDGKKYKPLRKFVYLAMNKPAEIITTMKDPQKRTTVFDLLPEKFKKFRPFPVGRLDYFSEGLLLLTNDGKFSEKVGHPRYEKEKEYEVIIRGGITEEALKDMRAGMTLPDGTKFLPIEIDSRTNKNGDTILKMVLKQGINRQIRRMCEKWNLVILKLKRTRIGDLRMGNLKSGECREFDPDILRNTAKDKGKSI